MKKGCISIFLDTKKPAQRRVFSDRVESKSNLNWTAIPALATMDYGLAISDLVRCNNRDTVER